MTYLCWPLAHSFCNFFPSRPTCMEERAQEGNNKENDEKVDLQGKVGMDVVSFELFATFFQESLEMVDIPSQDTSE